MIEDWLRLLYTKGASLSTKHFLLEQFGSPEAIFSASSSTLAEFLAKTNGRSSDPALILKPPSRALTDTIRADIQVLERMGADFLPCTSEQYPPLLQATNCGPLGLFYLGNKELLIKPQIAMVGSRHASRGGKETALHFSSSFCAQGFGVTSGLAIGIDTASHQGALDACGETTAVIATGIDQIYPARNRALHRAIAERGLVITEFPPKTPPRRNHFPSRNRIISGLSLATLVVEAGLQSGSLITARLAAEQGREVFAIPGSIHLPGSKGCHYLLKQGAAIAESPEEVLAEIGDSTLVHQNATFQKSVTQIALSPEQNGIFALLDFAPCPVDELIRHSGLTADQVSSILVQLELQGLVIESVGGYQRFPVT